MRYLVIILHLAFLTSAGIAVRGYPAGGPASSPNQFCARRAAAVMELNRSASQADRQPSIRLHRSGFCCAEAEADESDQLLQVDAAAVATVHCSSCAMPANGLFERYPQVAARRRLHLVFSNFRI